MAPTARDLIRYCRDLGWKEAVEAPEVAPAGSAPDAGECPDLGALAAFLNECDRCALSRKRKSIVFGEGSDSASLLFVGEAPGAEENRSGRPFVGQAGHLLDGMLFALGLERSAVYITNVVKCQPPGNRDPEEAEMAACSAVLDRQIELISPAVIVTLGRIAARRLIGSTKSMTAMRGRWSRYRGIPLMPLFHPAYMLRTPIAKRATWSDLKEIRSKLGE